MGILRRLLIEQRKNVIAQVFTNCLMLLVCLASTAATGADKAPQALSTRFENDSFGNTDENYTNGISLGLTTPGNGPLGWVWGLLGQPSGQRFATYELTQLQFTPSDLHLDHADPTDRPYAGALYLGLASHVLQEESLNSLKLLLGVVGPASYSEGLQRFTHQVLGYSLPNGWQYQIKNEPIFNLFYEYRHKFTLTPPDAAIGIQLIPMGGLFLGNFLSQAELAMQVRIGYQLPADFGTTVLRGMGYLPFPDREQAPHRWGVYAFAGGSANLIGWNITLDGNTVVESRSIQKRRYLPTAELGAALWTEWFQTTFSYVMMGREFNSQPNREDYGSILFSYLF